MRPVLKCKRCGHRWMQRKEGHTPKKCPRQGCGSPYWNKPRRTPKQ